MGKKISKKELKLIKSDKQYLDEYFKVCQLLKRKREFLKPDERKLEKLSKKEVKEYLKKQEKEISEIDKKLNRQDKLFWPRVKKSEKKGHRFLVEKLATHYRLDLLEKKIFLFFIYLESFCMHDNICTENELATIFDYQSSVVERLKIIGYFTSDSRLVKNRIILRKNRRTYAYTLQEYALSNQVLEVISRLLNGSRLEDAVERKTYTSGETIGRESTPQFSLDDVKLEDTLKEKVEFFLKNFKEKKLESLGVHKTIKNGERLAFLFYGPPGTGKSMLAEAIASYLGKKMLVVEFPKITSRWFGETDNNISRIFKTAEENNMVLCIDEADTLLYNRSYAVQEHDIRFVNVMLQELERFKGVAVLTTNMDILLDPALERRVCLKLKFREPEENIRSKIWQSHIPKTIKLAEDIDFTYLAKRYCFSGGQIKNAVLNALRKVSCGKNNLLTKKDLIFGANIEEEGGFNKDKNNVSVGFAVQ